MPLPLMPSIGHFGANVEYTSVALILPINLEDEVGTKQGRKHETKTGTISWNLVSWGEPNMDSELCISKLTRLLLVKNVQGDKIQA